MAIHVSAPNRGFVERYEVDSFDPRRAGTVYIVALNQNGSWECSCPVYKFKRIECKHVRAVVESRREEDRTPVRRPRRPRPEPELERTPVRMEPVTDEQFHITRIQALKEEMEV